MTLLIDLKRYPQFCFHIRIKINSIQIKRHIVLLITKSKRKNDYILKVSMQ